MGSCIAIVNQKGGVGKTTTAVNLGAALAEGGCRTLLVDLDPQANATTALGVDREAEAALMPRSGVYAALCGDTPVAEQVRPTRWTPLWVIPSSVDLAGAEVELSDDNSRSAVHDCLFPLIADYDLIILDTPPSLGVLTVNCLVAAQRLLIPVQCEYFALEGLRQLLHTIELIREALNPSLGILGLLRTMHDGRTNLSRQVADEIERFFAGKVFSTVVPRNVRLSEAPSFGEPVGHYAPRSAGASAYRGLAREVACDLGLPYEAPEDLPAIGAALEPATRPAGEQPRSEQPPDRAVPPATRPRQTLTERELIEID